jgi:Protein of unknown function (DUF3307)
LSWSAALLALLVSHAVGDVLLQTDWQAINKSSGLINAVGRRALLRHVLTYMVAFVPALVWIGASRSAGRAIGVAALIAVPHLLIDDGTLVRVWLRRVKGTTRPGLGLLIATDQTFHVVCLLGAALVAAVR